MNTLDDGSNSGPGLNAKACDLHGVMEDVFQEQNGIFHFDRQKKFDLERIRAAQVRVAAIEKDQR